jgi:hypothetical protein
VVLVLTTLADLVLRAQVMSRAPLAVAIVAVPDVMARTHFSAILTARAVMPALAALLSLARASALRILCLLIALAVVLTTTLTGHASGWGISPSASPSIGSMRWRRQPGLAGSSRLRS